MIVLLANVSAVTITFLQKLQMRGVSAVGETTCGCDQVTDIPDDMSWFPEVIRHRIHQVSGVLHGRQTVTEDIETMIYVLERTWYAFLANDMPIVPGAFLLFYLKQKKLQLSKAGSHARLLSPKEKHHVYLTKTTNSWTFFLQFCLLEVVK